MLKHIHSDCIQILGNASTQNRLPTLTKHILCHAPPHAPLQLSLHFLLPESLPSELNFIFLHSTNVAMVQLNVAGIRYYVTNRRHVGGRAL
jgi:hypothetical protein